MKFPSHIILDVSTRDKTGTFTSWTISFKNKTNLSLTHLHSFASYNAQSHRKTTTLNNYALRTLGQTPVTPNFTNLSSATTAVNNPLWDVFNINFLRKEKIYTKLKYSRCPQYDIVSGGVAALFSGFLGFLICEKFGLELLDSGDFYVFFMYVVFAAFSLRPLLRISDKSDTLWHVLTLNSLYTFIRDLVILVCKLLRSYFTVFALKTSHVPTPVKELFWKFQYVTEIYHFFRRLRIFLTNWPKEGYKTFREVK